MKKEFEKRLYSSLIIIPISLFFLFQGSVFFIFFLSTLFLVTSYELSRSADIGAAALDIDYQEYDEEKAKAERYSIIGWCVFSIYLKIFFP